MWNAGHLAWSHTEGCGTVSCGRMFDIETASGTVTQYDLGIPGTFVWSAAPGIDSLGNTSVIMSEMVPSTQPGLAVGGRSATGQIVMPGVVVSGVEPYAADRWGDYFAAAQDPVDGSLWMTGMYAAAGNYGIAVVHVIEP